MGRGIPGALGIWRFLMPEKSVQGIMVEQDSGSGEGRISVHVLAVAQVSKKLYSMG